ncbi:Uncharacterised protein [Mycobacterium tuberculosis]|nr:Uncharacterised protein [Mycobacterium tuberculosis]
MFSAPKMPVKGVLTTLIFRPCCLAMALMMSMSKPTICLSLFSKANGA